MRISVITALAFAGFCAPQFAFAEVEENGSGADDGGVGAENDPLVIEIVGETDVVPAPQPTPAPPPASTPIARPPKSETPRAQIPPPAHPWPYFGSYGRSRHHSVIGAAHPRNGKRLEALSFIPFLAASAISALALGLTALNLDYVAPGGEPASEDEQAIERERSQEKTRRGVLYAVPITGTLATLPFSLMIASSLSKDRIEGAVFGGALAGTVFGLGLDIGMACVLYFYASSIAATLIPPLVGLVVLPPIFGSIGAHLVASHRRARTIFVLPPAPTALVSPFGRASPGLALGGTF